MIFDLPPEKPPAEVRLANNQNQIVMGLRLAGCPQSTYQQAGNIEAALTNWTMGRFAIVYYIGGRTNERMMNEAIYNSLRNTGFMVLAVICQNHYVNSAWPNYKTQFVANLAHHEDPDGEVDIYEILRR